MMDKHVGPILPGSGSPSPLLTDASASTAIRLARWEALTEALDIASLDLTRAEVWSRLRELRSAAKPRPIAAATYTTGDRLRDIIDENYGMQPVMGDEDALSFLERKLFEKRRTSADQEKKR